MLLVVRPFRSLSGTNAKKDTDFPTGPLIADGFVQRHGSRVIFAGTFVEEHRLANLNRLEGQLCGRSRSSSLPNSGTGFNGGFFARVVGAEEDLARAGLLCAFVDSRDGPVGGEYMGFDMSLGYLRLRALLAIIVKQSMRIAPFHRSYSHAHRCRADLAISAGVTSASLHATLHGASRRHRCMDVC